MESSGLYRKNVIGNTLWDTRWFQHPADTERLAREAVERAVGGEFVRYEFPVQGADREAIFDFSIRPIPYGERYVTRLVLTGECGASVECLGKDNLSGTAVVEPGNGVSSVLTGVA